MPASPERVRVSGAITTRLGRWRSPSETGENRSIEGSLSVDGDAADRAQPAPGTAPDVNRARNRTIPTGRSTLSGGITFPKRIRSKNNDLITSTRYLFVI
ncbi:hypothetical protein GCM10023068_39250 [Leifsonia shinshuensis]